ncbi:MAG: hypothetical protein QOI59_724 [Gammaproteobacteria bacterium]|nr:hypothetical protein [Gammaproteobacteria bacterium]
MKDARTRGAVAKEDDADRGVIFGLSSPGGSCGQGKIPAHNTGRTEGPVSDINQMHRAAATVAQPAVAPDDFRKHGPHVAAFCEHVAVSSVAREQHVFAGETLTYPDSNGLLARRQVRKARNFACGCKPLDLALEQADAPECPIHSLPVVHSRVHMTQSNSKGYQVLLVALLSLNFGIVFFDRNALNFLMPFTQPDLHLSNTQVGILAGALSLTWALAAFGIGFIADRTGHRKTLLILATIAFSACSFLSGIAASFTMLLGARLLMGVAEGGIMPISQSMVATQIEPEHRGLAMGVTQNFGSNLLGSFAAPVLLVSVAAAYGWRHAFFLAGAPGLIAALLLWRFVRDPPPAQLPAGAAVEKLTMRAALGERNVWICALTGVLLVSYLVVCWAFMPLYLTQVRGFDPQTMGWLMGTLGISATVGAFAISALSDRIGRRPLMIAMPLLGVILPLGAMFFDGSVWVLAAIFFFGWGLNGVFPLFMATIPSESVDPLHTATVLGLCMGTGEVLGGVLAPFAAGIAADRAGLQAPLWMMVCLTLIGGVLALGLRETAPAVLARRRQSQLGVP